MADPFLDTASQRPATDLNEEARELLQRVAIQTPSVIVGGFFLDRYASYDDYFAGVESVWGVHVADRCRVSVAEYLRISKGRRAWAVGQWLHDDYAGLGLLRVMPEPDFRAAIHRALRAAPPDACEYRVTDICKNRGAPWRYTLGDGFEWTGDENVEALAITPAVSAVEDPRFAGGVRDDFISARAELGLGTSKALSQSIHQSGCAVESAMKVILNQHGTHYDAKGTAYKLFETLEAAGIVPQWMKGIVLEPITPRNQKGGHGAGAVAHAVAVEEAEAVFAAAAVAIAYLHTRLP
jgi:hypothetical protein